jgi:transcription-repair coupling factor (superfamily II helicase)
VVGSTGNASLAVTAPPPVQPLVAAALAVGGGSGSQQPGAGVPVLVVTAGERDADIVADLLRCVVPDRRVETFPAWETQPHERLSPRADTVGRRLAVLRAHTHPGATGTIDVLVAPVRSMLQPLAPGLGDHVPVELKPGDEAEIDTVADVWVGTNWYERETYDLMGISFKGHPDLRRILMYPEFEGHPLRKDYPATKTQPLIPYRTEEEAGLPLEKLAPFGVDEGMPFGRNAWAMERDPDGSDVGPGKGNN